MTKLTKTQKTLEQVFYQVKWKVDTVETVVNAKKGDTTEAITAGLKKDKGTQTVIIKKYLESHLNKPYQE
jgi:CHASE3 domain sensor protein